MARKVTFIHASDCHLGAAFKGLMSSSAPVAAQLVGAVSQAFETVIDECLQRNVDFLVLAGDTFNEGEVSYGVQHRFILAMQRLEAAGIEVYLCAGNHDPLATWGNRLEVLPSNVNVFPSDRAGYFLFERSGIPLVNLAGRSFESADEPNDLTDGLTRADAQKALESDAPFSIGVLHTGITDPRYAPCNPNRLHTSGFDYYALGHIHEKGFVGGMPVTYCGSPQGLDINENSEHCCLLVSLEENRAPDIKALPTAAVVWERPVVDISGITDGETLGSELTEIGRGLIARHHRPVCARIILTGAGPVHAFLRDEGNVNELCETVSAECSSGRLWFWVERLVDRTSAARELDTLQAEGLFPAAVMDEAAAAHAAPDDVVALIRDALAPLGLASLAGRLDVDAVVDRARDMCLDNLLSEEGK